MKKSPTITSLTTSTDKRSASFFIVNAEFAFPFAYRALPFKVILTCHRG
ncbi:hypothetical protein XBP1_2350003 [Xenorhabdus bovienii str. puntauvense]|uniref:Uncharacterized protein n=1 Tax=Xenorhabdus bovienii str. puntauvense TaxID=1398201 RepID=A0A077NGB8_XENBV|nr:hypothetical protein XBP1_2350003 [Xenorhabdus bovienii str. puntauvense]